MAKHDQTVFLALLKEEGIPKPEPEYTFAKELGRRWRADYCWPEQMVILEVEGGVWTRGRHTRGSGFVKDMEKYNAAATLGYRLLRVTPSDLLKDETIRMIKSVVVGESPPPELFSL